MRARHTAKQALQRQQHRLHVVHRRPLVLMQSKGKKRGVGGGGTGRAIRVGGPDRQGRVRPTGQLTPYLENVEADVAGFVDVWVEALGLKGDRGGRVRVAGRELEADLEGEPLVHLSEVKEPGGLHALESRPRASRGQCAPGPVPFPVLQ